MDESQGGNKTGIDIIVPSGRGKNKIKKKAGSCGSPRATEKKIDLKNHSCNEQWGKVIDLKEFIFIIRAGTFTYLIKVWRQITVNFRII